MDIVVCGAKNALSGWLLCVLLKKIQFFGQDFPFLKSVFQRKYFVGRGFVIYYYAVKTLYFQNTKGGA